MDRAIEQLLSQGGVWAALVVIVGFVAAYFYRDATKARESCTQASLEMEKRLTELNEKRLDELRQIITFMERNAQNAATLAHAVESNKSATAEVANALARLVQTQDASREFFRDQTARMERRLESIERSTGAA